MQGLRWGWLALGVLAATGCGVTLRAGSPPASAADALRVREAASDRCIHGTPGPDSPYREDLPGPVTDPELAAHLARFPPEVRRTAVAAGLEPLLARLMRERAQRGNAPPSPRELSMRLELSERIDSLETQLTAMEFECDCVRALLFEVLGSYEEAETDRQLALTIASLGVGAASSLVAGVWDLVNAHTAMPAAEDGPLITAIAGAVVTTALGVAVLFPVPQEIVYVHEHNLLRPIVQGDDPGFLYPVFVFRLLTLPTPGGAPMPRDELVAAFDRRVEESVDAEERAVAESIVYGDGGVHDPRLLRLHQDLLQELGATLDSFAREIDMLSHAVAIALEDDFVLDG